MQLNFFRSEVEIPEMTRFRHLFSSEEVMSETDALSMAGKRDPRIQKTTIFEDTSTFLLCKILSNSNVESVILSEKPLRTFHCIFQNSVWIPIYVGKFHAVFTDEGTNFPGFLVKKVNFYNWQEETKQSLGNANVDSDIFTKEDATIEEFSDVGNFEEEDEFMSTYLAVDELQAFTSKSTDKDFLDSFDELFEEH